ncbi:complex I 24 kDa subunit family protein [Treponema pedis]|uniref:NADH dehydrogenase (Ubiquinone) 24 kDa subunit n=2 Tax=Treponema pedis TaxID=409322 RepID=S5ZLF9_9SPIR|nr:NAD(P)H-dependent oxidoreductase subunit E [Treponema pedis]AGT43412.1 NADH dehydrogenase (ubiquinone) 24 kDa subunit [Treponema pedis str. T A4]QOW60957.1 NAD(P)H-dependent oxidoreductase subunit E [Treponema pedis]QSI04224.1 NAD(P)H-dependent oxidoreductase subunit E [Treponema pedis]
MKNCACFSDELNSFIDSWKEKPGNLIMILHKVQEEQGYISREAAEEVSVRTNTPLANVYGTMSFYHFFKTERPGKHKISVCLGTACYLKGSQDLLDEAKSLLGLKDGQTTSEDGEFSVEPVRCIGCCGLAPVISVNGEVHGKLKREDMAKIIADCRSESEVPSAVLER